MFSAWKYTRIRKRHFGDIRKKENFENVTTTRHYKGNKNEKERVTYLRCLYKQTE